MIHKVERYIAEHNLLQQKGKVLVALSGGADSVALLIALRKLGYDCEAIHCNFHLRDEESNRDERFVKDLCERLGTTLHTVHFNTAEYAKSKGISIEMAAREQRYAVFEEYRVQTGAQAIAVAHHRDDSAETLLLNLTRGTGIRGMRGIQPKNGYIVRPLLCVGRDEILDYLKWRGEVYVTDSTNLTNDYTRNKIRNEIVPLLREINPSILESLAATARNISEAEKIYRRAVDEAAERVKNGNVIDIQLLKREASPTALLHEILSPYGFNSPLVASIAASLDGNSGKIFCSGSHIVIKERSSLIIAKRTENTPVNTTVNENGRTETATGTLIAATMEFDGNIPKERNTALLDTDKLKFPLTLRNTQPGDRFAPFGMRGTKLVSDYLTDKKRTIIEKQRQLVVTDASGTIVWLVGERPAAPFCVDKNTKKATLLRWVAKQEA